MILSFWSKTVVFDNRSPVPISQGIVVILLVFLGLGLAYSIATPIFEGPDEPDHYGYVEFIANTGRLPVRDDQMWGAERHQPPLYYALAAAFIRWIPGESISSFVQPNPFGTMGRADLPGDKNMFFHTDRERFPYQGLPLRVHLVRWLGLMLGAGTIICTYWIAHRLAPGEPNVALAAAALVALNPQFVFISSLVNNDNMAIFTSALTLVILLGGLDERADWQWAAVLGASLGLASLSKVNTLAMAPLIAGMLVWGTVRRRSWVYLLRLGMVCSTAWLLIAGLWYWQAYQSYGLRFGISRQTHLYSPTEIVVALRGIVGSFWAAFGWFNIVADAWVYLLYHGLVAIGLLGLIRLLSVQSRHPGGLRLGVMAVLVTWLITGSTVGVIGLATTGAVQGRLFFPLLPALMVLVAAGWMAWVRAQWRLQVVRFLNALLTLVTAACLPLYILPAYNPPPMITTDQLSKISQPLDVDFGDELNLVGLDLDSRNIHPGQPLLITLYWKSKRSVSLNYASFVHLYTTPDWRMAQQDGWIGTGNFPSSLWQPGTIITDRRMLVVPTDVNTPRSAWIDVGVFIPRSGDRVEAKDRVRGRVSESVRLAPLLILPSGVTQPEVMIQHPTSDTLTGIALDGFDLEQDQKQVKLSFYWRSLEPLDKDYTVFVHLVGSDGRIRAQHDAPPLAGQYPTRLWHPGDRIIDEHRVPLGPNILPGVYQILVGLYDPATGTRLDWASHESNHPLLLASLEIKED